MIELLIDGRAVEIPPGCSVTLSASQKQLTNPSVPTQIFPFQIPATPNNRFVMGFAEQTLSPKQFNQTRHTGKVTCKGTTLLAGEIELVKCETNRNRNGRYLLNLIVKSPEWIAMASKKTLQEIRIPYENTLSPELIQDSWSSDTPVKFLPVKHDRYTAYGENQITLNNLSFDNYYPFVQVKALLDAVIRAAGYRIVSQFLNEPFFLSLYMSGRFPNKNPDDALRMNFEAYRSAPEKSTRADALGRVYATSQKTNNSVGNMVDAEKTYPGNPVDPAAQYFGKSFRMMDNRPAFVPESDTITAFEIRCRYSTEIKALPDRELAGITKIAWENETQHEVKLENSLTNYKDIPGEGGYYWVYRFDYTSGNRRLTTYETNGTEHYFNITAEKQQVYCPAGFTRAVLEEYSNGTYLPVENWALYADEDHKKLQENATYDITFRTQPRLRKKNEPVYFDTITFEGGLSGMNFTLSGASIKPLFYDMPANGENITLSSLFAHPEKQIKLIDALQHLFGLRFYTDELTKTVYIEPRFTFLNETHEIDWSEKIDPEKPVTLEEPGKEKHRTETFLYRSEDATISRVNEKWGTTYGAWSASIENQFAEPGEKKKTNPLFSATKDEKFSLASAPDASVIVAGDRERKNDNLSFPPKIVRYLGMKKLPDGQRWSWPSYGTDYPLAMFHSAGEDWFTLCFDNIGGQLGLKNYHLSEYDQMNRGKILTLYLRLSPSDMEAILYPNSTCRDFRGNFCFTIRGEKIRGRLIEVFGYDPGKNNSTRCAVAVEL